MRIQIVKENGYNVPIGTVITEVRKKDGDASPFPYTVDRDGRTWQFKDEEVEVLKDNELPKDTRNELPNPNYQRSRRNPFRNIGLADLRSFLDIIQRAMERHFHDPVGSNCLCYGWLAMGWRWAYLKRQDEVKSVRRDHRGAVKSEDWFDNPQSGIVWVNEVIRDSPLAGRPHHVRFLRVDTGKEMCGTWGTIDELIPMPLCYELQSFPLSRIHKMTISPPLPKGPCEWKVEYECDAVIDDGTILHKQVYHNNPHMAAIAAYHDLMERNPFDKDNLSQNNTCSWRSPGGDLGCSNPELTKEGETKYCKAIVQGNAPFYGEFEYFAFENCDDVNKKDEVSNDGLSI